MPVRFLNCHLQGKHKAAGKELHRFAYNTVFGVIGVADPARDKLGLEPTEEDLGQTLATYGAGTGIYLVLPIFGPSNIRDGLGFVGDRLLNPVRYITPKETYYGITAGKIVNGTSLRLDEYDSFTKDAIDPYIAMQRAYLQYRQKKIEE